MMIARWRGRGGVLGVSAIFLFKIPLKNGTTKNYNNLTE